MSSSCLCFRDWEGAGDSRQRQRAALFARAGPAGFCTTYHGCSWVAGQLGSNSQVWQGLMCWESLIVVQKVACSEAWFELCLGQQAFLVDILTPYNFAKPSAQRRPAFFLLSQVRHRKRPRCLVHHRLVRVMLFIDSSWQPWVCCVFCIFIRQAPRFLYR